jgi:YegS/Rv2252/BmrU family lipid kinase
MNIQDNSITVLETKSLLGIQRRDLTVIFNPVAGRRRRQFLDQVLVELLHRGFRVRLRETTRPGDAERYAREETTSGTDLLIAAGGDGTVNEVLNGLAGHPLPLAILPIGTTNVLAAEIDIPLTPIAYSEFITSAPLRQAWVGEAGGRRFALMVSVGFDAKVVEAINPILKRRFGKSAYLLAACQNLYRHAPSQYRVTVDGECFDAAAVIVAKSRYYGGRYTVAPQSRVTNPYLEVCLFGRSWRRDVARHAVALVRGSLASQPDVTLMRGTEVLIEGDDGEPVQGDGDILTCLPSLVTIALNPINLLMSEGIVGGQRADASGNLNTGISGISA